MDAIFVAQWFNEQDRSLISEIDEILYCQDIRPYAGRNLGGEGLRERVRTRIEQCDGLVALATRRDQMMDGRWGTHSWVIHEFGHASTLGKRCIAIVEAGVIWSGMHENLERIDLDRSRPAESLLKLSKTIATWKNDTGRKIRLHLIPPELNLREDYRCSYCLYEQGKESEWRNARIGLEPGGAFLYIDGIKTESQLVKVRVSNGAKNWHSIATPRSSKSSWRSNDMTLRILQSASAIGEKRWKWSVWFDGPDEELDLIQQVRYQLHPTFPNPIRFSKNRLAKFRLNGTGWGEFAIYATLIYGTGKQTTLQHWLRLEPRSDEGQSRTSANKQSPSVYISYSSADTELAHEIRKSMETRGLEVFTAEDIPAGANLNDAINGYIEKAEVGVVIISDRASPWVLKEASKLREASTFVVPVLMSDSLPPEEVADYLNLVRVTKNASAEEIVDKVMQFENFAGSSRP